jgi:hypothetical protein
MAKKEKMMIMMDSFSFLNRCKKAYAIWSYITKHNNNSIIASDSYKRNYDSYTNSSKTRRTIRTPENLNVNNKIISQNLSTELWHMISEVWELKYRLVMINILSDYE